MFRYVYCLDFFSLLLFCHYFIIIIIIIIIITIDANIIVVIVVVDNCLYLRYFPLLTYIIVSIFVNVKDLLLDTYCYRFIALGSLL